jgi:hypothetical protein
MTEAPHDPDHVREWIKNDLEATARWRFDKAAEYPNDARNEKVAALLETLAATVPGIQAATLERLDRTFSATPDIEAEWNVYLRCVGFASFPDSAEDLVREFLEGLRDKVGRPALRSVDPNED